MAQECIQHCLPSINESLKEKSKIAEAASSTLQKLNSVMRQIKELREDRAKLKSNLWKLKTTLHSDKSSTNVENVDPIIEHQKEEIKRLEETNEALEQEIAKLRNVLATAEDTAIRNSDWKVKNKLIKLQEEYSSERKRLNDEIVRLKKRLKETGKSNKNSTLNKYKTKLMEIERGDQTMEIIFTNVASKVAETVAHLSEELVNTTEDLYQSKSLNDNLILEVDRLYAILRIQTGDNVGYKKRMNEIETITQKLKSKSCKLKLLSETSESEFLEIIYSPKFVESLEYLFKDLKYKLRNDYEAIIAAGDLNFSNYVKKIINLHMYLKNLQKKIKNANLGSYEMRQNQIITVKLEETLSQVHQEVEKLKMDRVNQCKVINVDGPKFLKKIYEIEDLIQRTEIMVTKLNASNVETSDCQKIIKSLDDLIGNLCVRVQELEENVNFQENSLIVEKNEQLKNTIVKLKVDLDEKNNNFQKLEEKFQEKTKFVEELEKKLLKSIADNKALKEESIKKDRIVSDLTKDLQHIRQDKNSLMVEAEKSRCIVMESNERISKKDAVEKVLRTENEELKTKLASTINENTRLSSKVNELSAELEFLETLNHEKSSENTDSIKQLQNRIDTARSELEHLRSELNKKIIESEKAESRNSFLRDRLAEFEAEKGRLESDIINLISCKESLKCQLEVEKQNIQKVTKELDESTCYNRTFQNQIFSLQSQNDALKAEVIELRARRDYLKMTMEDLTKKRASLEEQIQESRTSWINLIKETGLLELHLDQLNEIGCETIVEKVRSIKQENSRLNTEIYDMALKCKEVEGQNQMFAVENNELIMRADEQKDEISFLKEKMDKINEEKETLSMELSESKIANNNLQKVINEMKRLIEDLKAKSNIPDRDRNILNDQFVSDVNGDAYTKLRSSFLYSNSSYLNVFDVASKNMIGNNELMQNYNPANSVPPIDSTGKGLTFLLKNHNVKLDSDANSSDNENSELKAKLDEKSKMANQTNLDPKIVLQRIQLKPGKLSAKSSDKEITIKNTFDKVDLLNINWAQNANNAENNFEGPGLLNEFYKAGKGTIILHNEMTGKSLNNSKEFVAIEELKVENINLRKEITVLRSGLRIVFEKYQKAKGDFRKASEEMRALKLELAISRNEKKELQIHINAKQLELDRIKSERVALKEELMSFRKRMSRY